MIVVNMKTIWITIALYIQGRYVRRTTIFIFSFCIGLVTQLNGSALGVLKHHYITKRIRELLIGNSRFLIYNSFCLFVTEFEESLDLNN